MSEYSTYKDSKWEMKYIYMNRTSRGEERSDDDTMDHPT